MLDNLAWLQEHKDIMMVVRLVLAAILGGIVGIERGSGDRPAGFRTHILVCVVNRPQAAQLCAILRRYPHTFAMMNPVNEVVGNFKHVSNSGREVQPILDRGDGENL